MAATPITQIKPVGFFEQFVDSRQFAFAKPSSDVLSKWSDLRNNADAEGTMLVQTNSFRHQESAEWALGERRLMTCVLC